MTSARDFYTFCGRMVAMLAIGMALIVLCSALVSFCGLGMVGTLMAGMWSGICFALLCDPIWADADPVIRCRCGESHALSIEAPKPDAHGRPPSGPQPVKPPLSKNG